MSERDQLVQSIIVAAIAAAGPRGTNDAAWKGKINGNISAITAMMNEGTRQWKNAVEVLDADIFVATFKGYELEESSKRLIVTLYTKPSKRYPDGLEPIRTHRTDNAAGRMMEAKLKDLRVDDEIIVWKAMETSAHDPELKVRVLVHFETRPKFTSTEAPKTSGSAVEGSAQGRSYPSDAPAESRPGPATSAGTQSDEIVTGRFDDLPSKVKAAVVKRARAAGITIPVPQDDRLDEFITIINEEEKAHGD